MNFHGVEKIRKLDKRKIGSWKTDTMIVVLYVSKSRMVGVDANGLQFMVLLN